MERHRLKRLLERVRKGTETVEQALRELRLESIEQLEYATLDLDRAVRRGFPEVIYGAGKTPEQISGLVERLDEAGQTVLVTRVGPEVHAEVERKVSGAVYHPVARALTVERNPRRKRRPGVTLVTAGTTDRPVAEEAALTAELMGQEVERLIDVGVAGLHRLLNKREVLSRARVLVVVAGMEGALPSVVAGLTDCPVIGVPTSTGYGVGADGRVPLMAMLCSCSPGVTVVNVDNGFGAGYAAALINDAGKKGPSRKTPKNTPARKRAPNRHKS